MAAVIAMQPGPAADRTQPCPLESGAATRPRPPLQANGDACAFLRFDGGLLVALIDGLGHGERAQRASEVALRYLESHARQGLAELFRGVARVCHATDGVVMAAARFEFDNAVRFSFASVGNIEARLFGPSKEERLMLRRGILGAGMPEVRVTEHIWQPGSSMILHSDGVAARWRLEDFEDWNRKTPLTLAQVMLERLAKPEDDATVVVIREPRR